MSNSAVMNNNPVQTPLQQPESHRILMAHFFPQHSGQVGQQSAMTQSAAADLSLRRSSHLPPTLSQHQQILRPVGRNSTSVLGIGQAPQVVWAAQASLTTADTSATASSGQPLLLPNLTGFGLPQQVPSTSSGLSSSQILPQTQTTTPTVANLISAAKTKISAAKTKAAPTKKTATAGHTKATGAKRTVAKKAVMSTADVVAAIAEASVNPGPSGRVEQYRERNREHARSTRLRKKAYVQKLKDMAYGLRVVQTDEIRQRRIAMQKLMEIRRVRRAVVRKFLHCHSNYESDPAKWNSLLEEGFWLKQPITPFRSFRRSEVDGACRIVRGTEALICEAASISVMVERNGCHNARWKRIKRSDFMGNLDLEVQRKEASFAGQQTESSLSSDCRSVDSTRATTLIDQSLGNDRKIHSLPPWTASMEPSCSKIVSSSSECGQSPNRASLLSNSSDKKRDTWGPAAAAAAAMEDGTMGVSSADELDNGPAIKRPKMPLKVARGPVPIQAFSSAQLNLVNKEQLGSYYAINEDDMIMIEDVMMCPFVYRTKNAVLCGALTDCIMSGMLRAQFSKSQKLLSAELVYDSMGFMQQLDMANGGGIPAQVIPNSLEMALSPCTYEARVITEAKAPYSILHVNDAWTALTNYTQLDCEGEQLFSLLKGENTDPNAGLRPGCPIHSFEEVARGRAACSTNIHYGKSNKTFLNFMCSYPLTNESNEITHLVHVCTELPNS